MSRPFPECVCVFGSHVYNANDPLEMLQSVQGVIQCTVWYTFYRVIYIVQGDIQYTGFVYGAVYQGCSQ